MPGEDHSGLTAVILAGGKGTRIAALHPDVPKPMISVAGQPFLYWVTAYLAHCGLRRFVYSSGHKAEQITRWCSEAAMPGLDRSVAVEQSPLGTGGAALHCLDHCREWLIVTNGDSLCLGGVQELAGLASRTDTGSAGGLVGLYQTDTARFGSLDIDPTDNSLKAFREKLPGAGLINGGTYLLRKSALLSLGLTGKPSSMEHDVIPRLLVHGWRLSVVRVKDAPFIDIGTPASLSGADAFIKTMATSFVW